MSGLELVSDLRVRTNSDGETRAAGVWAATEVLAAMPDASEQQHRDALAELLDCLGLQAPA